MKTEAFSLRELEETRRRCRRQRKERAGSELLATFVLFLLLALYWWIR